jgi:Ca2+-transporting ATPase
LGKKVGVVVQAVHNAIKGRVRVRVNGLYRSESFKKFLEFRLAGIDGISHASGNILTSNLLIIFNSGHTPSEITSLIVGITSEYRNQTTSFDSTIPEAIPARTLPTAQRQPDQLWHTMNPLSVLTFLDTPRGVGLSSEIARERLKRHGLNILPQALPRSKWGILIDQLTSLPVALLGAAAGLSLVTGGVVDALVILGVVCINAAIGYITETQTEATLHSLQKLVSPSATVVRDGAFREIKAEEIAVGDLLVLRPGSYIAADARLIETHYLYVDESALTGENMPVLKAPESFPIVDIPLADRINMVYMGTLVTGGEGIAVVVATGGLTEMGQIQVRMGNQLVVISGAVCGLVLLIGLLRGYSFLEMLKISISLAVAAVPEGLPTVATTTLALGIRNMRRHHVLIRHLSAVETLGSVQTICLDKTGTITLNRMSVVTVHTGMKVIQVSEGKFISGEWPLNPFTCDELLRLMHVSVLCSETEVKVDQGEYVLRGSPTENALVHLAISAGIDVLGVRKRHSLLKITHRSENRNFMTTLYESDSFEKLLAVKGSPAEVLAMCKWYMRDGQRIHLSDPDRLNIEIENERMAGDSLRVLGVAYAHLDQGDEKSQAGDGLIWLGLVGMADPIRKGVKKLIETFHRAGIDTVMITGDQSPTAYAIGKELNLSGDEALEILDSTHFTKVDPDVMEALSKRVHVFARVSPAHKLQIVQSLQKSGKVVAMTGDGINDGPALKAADIGIAMGHTGTDVAREVADVVLEDDNLETMVVAVSHGRTIYNNIRKSVRFLLATNLSEILVMFSSIAVGLGEPLNSMQLLWINLLSDIFPGLALALEPPEPEVLSRPPRNPGDPILQLSDLKKITFEAATLSAGAMGAYGYGLVRYGAGPQAGTLAFMSLVTGQLLHAVSCRSERHSIYDPAVGRTPLPPNPYLNIALGGSLALQIAAIAFPGLRKLLGITPIGLLDGLVVGGTALIPHLINETAKLSIQTSTNHSASGPSEKAMITG